MLIKKSKYAMERVYFQIFKYGFNRSLYKMFVMAQLTKVICHFSRVQWVFK